MTKERAIELLKNFNLYDEPNCMGYWDCDECVEALYMGIEAIKKEPKQRHWVGTPKEFAEKMRQLAENGDPEADHIKSDELMCQLLTSLGYGEGVKIFKEMYKWYS